MLRDAHAGMIKAQLFYLMKTFMRAVALLTTLVVANAKDRTPEPVSTINFRGEELPVYAAPHLMLPQKSAPPEYPKLARKETLQGEALLTLLVDINGKVSEAEIISSKPLPSFGVAARTAALKWRYRPLKRNGTLTKFIVQQPFVFRYVEGRPSGAFGLPENPDAHPPAESASR